MAASKKPDGNGSPGRVVQGHVDDWEELAIDYLDGALDTVSKAAVDAHLEGCSACAARLGMQQAVCDVLHDVKLEDAPSGLEDEVIGEILFPPTPRREIVPAARRSRWAAWRRRYRPWMPVSVAVVAFFAIMISVGVLRSGGSMEVVTTTAAAMQATATPKAEESSLAAAPTTTGAPATTMVAAGVGGTSLNDASDTSVAGSGGPMTATTGSPSTTYTFATPPQDKKAMVAQLQAASAPLYFVYQQSDPGAGASSAATGAVLAEQITMLTGLEPLEGDLALDGATFAAFVPKKDAAALVELLQSIGSSLRLTLNLVGEPVALPNSTRGASYGQALEERKAQLPELLASKTPQPAVTKYSFTTSTVVPDSGQAPPDSRAPYDTSTHVLVVIYLGE